MGRERKGKGNGKGSKIYVTYRPDLRMYKPGKTCCGKSSISKSVSHFK